MLLSTEGGKLSSVDGARSCIRRAAALVLEKIRNRKLENLCEPVEQTGRHSLLVFLEKLYLLRAYPKQGADLVKAQISLQARLVDLLSHTMIYQTQTHSPAIPFVGFFGIAV
nr:hypothetical protein [Pelagibius litoralis]